MTVDPLRLQLLQSLCERHDSFVVWKHLERALRGRGDIDAAVPRTEVGTVRASAMRMGASTLEASHIIGCDHVADKRLLFFVQPARLPTLFELDLCVQPSRGLSPWASPVALRELSVLTPDRIRTLRPGAEALVSLVYHGVARSGADRLRGDERSIVERGLAIDQAGAYAACELMAPRAARQPLHDLVAAVIEGGWEPTRARRAYVAFIGHSLGHPRFLARRAGFRITLARGGECVMSRIARLGKRQVPESGLTALLTEAGRTGHIVVPLMA